MLAFARVVRNRLIERQYAKSFAKQNRAHGATNESSASGHYYGMIFSNCHGLLVSESASLRFYLRYHSIKLTNNVQCLALIPHVTLILACVIAISSSRGGADY